jgi:hypothetical protein
MAAAQPVADVEDQEAWVEEAQPVVVEFVDAEMQTTGWVSLSLRQPLEMACLTHPSAWPARYPAPWVKVGGRQEVLERSRSHVVAQPMVALVVVGSVATGWLSLSLWQPPERACLEVRL